MTKQQTEVKAEVCSIVNRIIENPAARPDILQNIWINLLAGYKNYKEEGHILAWVRTVARHECIDFYRMQAKKQKILGDYSYYVQAEVSEGLDPVLIKREIFYAYKERIEKIVPSSLDDTVKKSYFLHLHKISAISREFNVTRKYVTRVVKGEIKKINQIYDEKYEEISDLETFEAFKDL